MDFSVADGTLESPGGMKPKQCSDSIPGQVTQNLWEWEPDMGFLG